MQPMLGGCGCVLDATIISSETPSSIKKVFSAYPMSAFLSIGYISDNYVPLDNNSSYRFPSKNFTCQSILSVAHMYVSLLVWKTMSALYRLIRVITAD